MNLNKSIHRLKLLDLYAEERENLIRYIGSQLKDKRKSMRLKVKDIAKIAEVAVCYVSQAENGHKVPSMQLIEAYRIAEGRYNDEGDIG